MNQYKIPREYKAHLTEDVQHYLEDHFSERVGSLAAEAVLDYVLNLVAPFVYNQAIGDARKTAFQVAERVDEELSFLETPLRSR